MSKVTIEMTADSKAVVTAAKQAGEAMQSMGGQAEQAASHLQAAGKASSNLAASSTAAKQAGEAMQSMGNQAEQAAFHLQAAGKAGSNLAASSTAAKQASEAMRSLGSQAEQTAFQAQAASKASAEMANRVGMSAKEMSAAIRGIPAQFTDIVTSLASGQAPLTVLMQQGGQLKDQFHGIVPAVKAVGAYVAGLVNPFTVAAAAAGVLYVAYEQGRRESGLFAQALLKTGNITGTTTGQLNEMAKALGHGEFTRGAAAAALAELAGTGAVASKNLQGFTQTALEMQRYVGVSVQDTAKEFKALADDPTTATLKLNDSLHFLTLTQYEQIKSLEEHSKKTEAASVAQKAYSDALKPMLESAKNDLGLVERAWAGVTKGAKEAWDAMLKVGRKETLDSRLDTLQKDLQNLNIQAPNAPSNSLIGREKSRIAEQIAGLQELVDNQNKATAADADRQKVQEAGIKWSQEGDKYLTKELQLKKQISQIEALGQEAGLGSSEIAARIALARQDYDKSIAAANSESLISAAKGNAKRYSEYYKQELDTFRMSTADYLEKIRDLERNALQVERRAVAGEKTTTAEDRIKKQSRLAELDAQIREVGDKYQRALEDEDTKNQKLLNQMSVAAGKALDPLTQAGIAFSTQYGDIMRRAAVDGNDSIIEAGRAVWVTMADKAQFETAKKQYDDLFAQLTTELDAVRQVADLDGGLFAHIDAAGKSEEIKGRLIPSIDEALAKMREFKDTDMVSDKTVVEASASVKKLTTQVDPYFKKMADGIETSLTDALMRGFESGKDFGSSLIDTLKNMFKALVLRPVIQAIIQPVMGTLGLGGTTAAMAGQSGGSVLGAASNLSSLYSAYNSASVTGYLGGGGAVASVGGMLGSSSMALVGTGMQMGSGASGAVSAYSAAGMTAEASALQAGAAIGPYASALGGAMVGIMAGKMISGGYSAIGKSGNTAVAVGTAAGAAIGSVVPIIGTAIGAVIGGAVGGVVNRAFGMGAKKVQGTGISGTFSDSGASVREYADWKQKGGWFRSDKSGTNYSAISSELNQYLDTALQGVTAANKAYAASLGLSADAVNGFSQSIKLNLQGLDEAGQQKAIADAVGNFGQAMVDSAWGSAIAAYQRTSETSIQTLARLSTSLTSVNQIFDTLGRTAYTAYTASLAGADMAQQLIDVFGGLDKLSTATSSYYQNYYTEQERSAAALRQVHAALSVANLAMPATTAEFRKLVEAQDLSTESGRSQFAMLVQLSPAFHDATLSINAYTKSLQDQATSIDDYVARLKGGKDGLATPAQQLASLRGSYIADLSAARAGDSDALGRITTSAQSYIDAQKAVTASSGVTQAVIDQVAAELSGVSRGLDTQASTAIPKFASGGYHEGGWAIVGENGPELANFSAPARIYTASQTRGMLSNGELLQEIRALHKTIADMSQRLEALSAQQSEETRALINSNASIQSQAADRVVRGVASAGERRAWVKNSQPVIA